MFDKIINTPPNMPWVHVFKIIDLQFKRNKWSLHGGNNKWTNILSQKWCTYWENKTKKILWYQNFFVLLQANLKKKFIPVCGWLKFFMPGQLEFFYGISTCPCACFNCTCICYAVLIYVSRLSALFWKNE